MNGKRALLADQFVPADVMRYLSAGLGSQVPCRIKMRPADFQVEEVSRDGRLNSVEPAYNVDEEVNLHVGSPTTLAATLVLQQLTTFDGVKNVAKCLGVPANRVSYGGLKDRWAITAQEIRIEGVYPEDVIRECRPEALRGPGWFITDLRLAKGRLSKGQLKANRFTLNVAVPRMSKSQLEAYIAPRLALLADKGMVFPNVYGRQRLGRRQNLAEIGGLLITEGPEKAIYRFLTETSPNEKDGATQTRRRIAELWPDFNAIKSLLEEEGQGRTPMYSLLNMGMEHTIISNLVKAQSHGIFVMQDKVQRKLDALERDGVELGLFDRVMGTLLDEFSLWVGAYQSAWFNQALHKYLQGEIQLPKSGCIPLFMCEDEETVRRGHDHIGRFYRKNLPEAIPERIDPAVKALFLTPRKDRRGKVRAPWRQAMIEVCGLEYECKDEMWQCRFELRSGGYATTLLGLLFNLDQDESEAKEKAAGKGGNRRNGGRKNGRWQRR